MSVAKMLLTPIPLARAILRAHRRLPVEEASSMSSVTWDTFFKSEFRRHKDSTNPQHIMGFLSQWKLYLDHITAEQSGQFRGKRLDPTVWEKVCAQMSPDQVAQLYELMRTTNTLWKPLAER
ncbi:ACN9-domain-containing protein [Auriculariales sp. MPI-PUGE-AT-0066]|nr:ACN9-domain-containing protein [Auriculariales sp. MPI-PUGE-AT-0066]